MYYIDANGQLQDDGKQSQGRYGFENGKLVRKQYTPPTTTTTKKEKSFGEKAFDVAKNINPFLKAIDLGSKAVDFVQEGKLNTLVKENNYMQDGYDFRDVTKTILGTTADLDLNIAEGIMTSGEGLGDLLSYGYAGVQDLLGNEEKAAEVRRNAQDNAIHETMNYLKEKLGINKASVLGNTSQEIAQGAGNALFMYGTAGLGGAAGLGSKGTTALTSAVTFTSAMGNGMSEAYQNGATDDEALKYGIISGAAEAATELMFGGLGKGTNAIGISKSGIGLDDQLAKKVSSKFKSQFAKNLAEYTIKAGAEGLEEVVSGIIQGLGKYMTYRKGDDLGQILKDEQLLNQFIVGAATSGIMQVPGLVKNTKAGRDFVTNYTQNEQRVVDREIQNRIEEQEVNGKKLTTKQINAIREQVESDLEKGYISTKTIENELGLENYIVNKIADIQQKTGQQLTNEEIAALTQEAKQNFMNDIANKDGKLIESYAEAGRINEAFQTDLSKYSDKQAKIIQKAIDSGILNNTNRTHEFVDFVSKIATDKGVDFDFTNNERLKGTQFSRDGKVTNGYVDANGNVTLNIDSTKSLNSVVGHEITHVLEGTDLYNDLRDAVKEYATSIGEYQDRYNKLKELYEGENADISKELTADIVGDYLFTDADFVNSLSIKNKNVFQKIYDEIKYLLKQVTTGSKEERELNKVKKIFDEAYRTNVKGRTNGTNYSLVYANENAQLSTNDKKYLNEAIKMQENGATDEEIWQKTGVILDNDVNKIYYPDLKFIDNKNLSSLLEFEKEYKLSDVMEGNLFDKYPQLKDKTIGIYDFEKEAIKDNLTKEKIEKYKKTIGAAGDDGIVLNLTAYDKTNREVEGIISHEVQHLIQEINGIKENTFDLMLKEGKEKYRNSPVEIEAEVTRVMNALSKKNIGYINPQSVEYEIRKYYKNHDNNAIDVDEIVDTLKMKHGVQFSLSPSGEMVDSNGDKVTLETSDTGNTGTLMAIHNLNEEKFNGILDLGGFPYPSIAITKPSTISHEGYGDGSAIFDKNTIDPELNSKNKVYSRDAYTPRFPSVEYKVNSNEKSNIRNIMGDYDYRNVTPGDEYISEGWSILDNLEDNINRTGLDRTISDIKNSDAMKYIYMKNIDPEFKAETKNETYSSKYDNETLQRFLDNYNGEYDLNDIPSGELEKYASLMVEAYKQQLEEKYSGDEYADNNLHKTLIDMGLKNLEEKFYEQDNFKQAAYKLQKYGTEKQVLDKQATREKLDNQINQEEYEKWVDNLFSNIIEKKGLRNNKDYYTSSGNPRSFEQLHDEYNLENVVKIMDSLNDTGEEGGFFYGISEIAGNASQRFNTIEDIKANENLLTTMGNEEYANLLEGMQERLSTIQENVMERGQDNSDNYFIARDNMASVIADAARIYGEGKKIDANKIQKMLKEYGFDATIEESQQILDMFGEMRNLPTQYFEAKPKRAVTFDELGLMVIPNNWSETTKQRMIDNNIKYAEYDPNIEGDRQRVINQYDDLKFALSQSNEIAPIGNYNVYGKDIALQDQLAPVKEDVNNLTEEIAAIREDYKQTAKDLKEQVEELKQLREELFTPNEVDENYIPTESDFVEDNTYYEPTVTPLDEKTLNKYKKYFSKEFGVKGRQLTQAMEGIKELNNNPNLTKKDVYNYLKQNFGKDEVRVMNSDISELKSELRHTPIGITDDIKNEMAYTYDSYGKFRKQYFGKLKLVDYNGQNSVDRVFENLAQQYPSLLSVDETNNTYDQLRKLAEITDMDSYNSFFEDIPESEIRAYADELYGMINENRLDALKKLAEKNKVPQSYYDEIAPVGEEETYYDLDQEISDIENRLNNIAQEEEQAIISKKNISNYENIKDNKKPSTEAKNDIMELVEQEINRRNGNVELREPKIAKEKSRFRKTIDTLKEMFINRNVEIDNLAKDSGNMNIKYYGDMLNNAAAEASNDINVAQTDNYGRAIGKSVDQLFEPARKKGLETALNEYLINYSNIDRWNNGKGSSTPLETSEKIVAGLEQQYPELKEWAEDVWKYGKNARDNMLESGLINQGLYDYLEEKYPHYVPYVSDTSDLNKFYQDIGEIKARAIKKAKGGATKLQPVQDALNKYTYSLKRGVRANQLYTEIVNTLLQSQENANMTIPEKMDYTSTVENLYRDDTGNYLTAVIDGQEKSVRISPELYRSLSNELSNQVKNLEQRLSFVTKPLQKLSNVRRKLLTEWNPTFLVKNALKDVQDASFNSKYTKDFAKNYPTAYKELITESKLAKQFTALYGSGNIMGQYDVDSGLYKGETQTTEKGGFSKAVGKLANANNIIELAPRFAEFKATLQNGGTLQEALYNAREITTNFGRGGVITKALNRNGFTFLNASVQGFDKFIRNFSGENGARGVVSSLAKAVALGVAPAILNELAFGMGDDKDEEYEALPDYIKDNYYLIKYDDGSFIRIPKGRMLSVFGSAARRTIELAEGEEEAFEGYLNNVNNQIGISDPEENNIFAPFIQAFGSENGNAWYGGDIVPTRLQDKPASEQYDASTDKFSIWLGDKLGVSPYKINYVLDQYSGGIGDIAIPLMTDEAQSEGGFKGLIAPVTDQFTADSVTDNKYVSDFYTKNDELKVQANSSKASDEDLVKNQYMYGVSSEMAKLYAERREIQSDNSLSKSEKYKKSQAIKKEINKLAKEGLDTYNNVSVTGSYAEVGDDEFYKNAKGKWTEVKDEDIKAINEMGLTDLERSQYFETSNEIYNISQEYKENSKDQPDKYKTYLSNKKKKDTINTILTSGLTDEAKAYLYDKSYGDTDTLNAVVDAGIDFDSYLKLQAQNFTADKDNQGNTISGSKKAKVYNYINSLDIPYEDKIMLAKLEYKSDDRYNNQIISYLNNNNRIDYQTMEDILKAMGFKVDEFGNISW